MKGIFFLLISICSITLVNAQMDRSVGMGQYKNNKKSKNIDIVESSIETLKEKLALDDFQEAIFRNMIKDNQAKSKVIIEATTLSNVEKRAQLQELSEKFNIEVKKILSPDQVEKYDKLTAKNKK